MAYPIKKYNYKIIMDGITRAGFSEVSAADWSSDPIEYREGTDAVMTVSKMPGLSKYGNITLKWGLSADKEFTDWVINISAGTVERKKITIQAMNDANTDILAAWEVVNAWPCKYTAPDLNASSSEAAFESVEMAHEGFKRTQ